MKTFLASVFLFVIAWSYLAGAQAPSASPAPSAVPVISAPAVVVPSGIMGWINSHGGFQGAVLLLVGAAFTMLSAFRQVLAAYDGVPPGGVIPENLVGLTKINKLCLLLGKAVDFLTGNVQH